MSVRLSRALVGIGVIFFIGLILAIVTEANFLRMSAKVVGTVESLEKDGADCVFDKNNRLHKCKKTRFTATVKYIVDGTTYRVRVGAGLADSPPYYDNGLQSDFAAGQAVALRYVRKFPFRAKVDDFFSNWGMALLMFLGSMLAIVPLMRKMVSRPSDSKYEEQLDRPMQTGVPVNRRTQQHEGEGYKDSDVVPKAEYMGSIQADEEDKEFASRYGTRAEVKSSEADSSSRAQVRRTKLSSRVGSGDSKRIDGAIESRFSWLTSLIRPIGVLLGAASFAVTGYYGVVLFVLDDAKDSAESFALKGFLLLIVFVFATGAAGIAYRLLEILAGIFQRE